MLRPRGKHEHNAASLMHRACPPDIDKGYAVMSSPPMPLSPDEVPVDTYKLRAEAITQDGKRIFCIEGTFNVTT